MAVELQLAPVSAATFRCKAQSFYTQIVVHKRVFYSLAFGDDVVFDKALFPLVRL